jgi:hypothetical protein
VSGNAIDVRYLFAAKEQLRSVRTVEGIEYNTPALLPGYNRSSVFSLLKSTPSVDEKFKLSACTVIDKSVPAVQLNGVLVIAVTLAGIDIVVTPA